ncbi:hypothetical protein [Noviherbaspirillum agri]
MQLHCLPHIDDFLPGCIGSVTDVCIPPQAINETAIQIKLFSCDVGIMMKALAYASQQNAAPKQMNWLAGVFVSLHIQLPGDVQYECVGLFPTARAGSLPRALREGRWAIGKDCDIAHNIMRIVRWIATRSPYFVSTGRQTRRFFRIRTVIRSAAHKLALKVQGMRLAGAAIAECSAAVNVANVATARTNLKMQ